MSKYAGGILRMATMMALMNDRPPTYRCIVHIGPEPHEYTKDEADQIAHQIAQQRSTKRRKR